MDYGLKVSKAGFNVLTCADKDLVYSSKFATFRVFAFGSGSIVSNFPTETVVTITHSLGYRPAFAVYSQIYDVFVPAVTSEYSLLPYTDPLGGDASIIAYCNTTQLKIRFGGDHAPISENIAYRYFIFHNQAR